MVIIYAGGFVAGWFVWVVHDKQLGAFSVCCTGGEECFQGVCRVPCEDEADCVACPGNPICGLGGYCMDENDVNPECTLSEDCTDSKDCVDAMCI